MKSLAASVITAVYNAEPFIARTVESVLSQTMSDFEWVIVDDGSKDDTCAVIESFGDSRIRLVRQKNRGPSAARNAAVRAARGPVVLLLDHDDVWFPQRLERLLRHLGEHPEVGFASTDMFIGNPDEPESATTIIANRDCAGLTLDDALAWARGCGFSASSAAIRRELFERHGGFDEGLWFVQDWEYSLRFWLRGERAAMIPEVHGWTVMRPGQLSASPWGLYYDRRAILQRILEAGSPSSFVPLAAAQLEQIEHEQVGISLVEAEWLAVSRPSEARARAIWALRRRVSPMEGMLALAYSVSPRTAHRLHPVLRRVREGLTTARAQGMFHRPDSTYAIDPAAVQLILADPSNPLHRAAQLIPDSSKVLDIGAGNGLLAQVLAEARSDLILDGVEPNEEASRLAAEHYRSFHVGYAQDISDQIRAEKYDYIVLADVIEHVADPLAFLRDVVSLAATDTKILVSVPNVAFGSVRLSLLRGDFRYVDSGLLERTHLRFFTLETLRDLFNEVGLGVEREIHHQKDIVTSEIRLRLSLLDALVALRMSRDPLASTYQFFFVLGTHRVDPVAPERYGPRSRWQNLAACYRAGRGERRSEF